MYFLLKMGIFHWCVSLPEGNSSAENLVASGIQLALQPESTKFFVDSGVSRQVVHD